MAKNLPQKKKSGRKTDNLEDARYEIINENNTLKVSRSKKFSDSTGVILIALGVLFFVALISSGSSGKFGHAVKLIYSLTFGKYISYVIPATFITAAILIFRKLSVTRVVKLSFVLFIIATISSCYIATFNYIFDNKYFIKENSWEYVGAVGYYLDITIREYFGDVGAIIVLTTLFIVTVIFAFNFNIALIYKAILYPVKLILKLLSSISEYFRKKRLIKKYSQELKSEDDIVPEEEQKFTSDSDIYSDIDDDVSRYQKDKKDEIEEEIEDDDDDGILFDESFVEEEFSSKRKLLGNNSPKKEETKDDDSNIAIEDEVKEREVKYKTEKDKEIGYRPPSIDLLQSPKGVTTSVEDDEALKRNAHILIEKLAEFKVDAEVVKINKGPVITQYEIMPAPGIRLSKISSLDSDLAMALKAESVRIVAPIPRKDTVGIEIPNPTPAVVYLKSIINSEKFINHKSKLAIAVGKTISGENYILDLAKTPHLLIAGATGSGKSVCINGLIVSLLYRATPEEVQFCMIDPKKVELSVYSDLLKHHLLKVDGIDDAVVTEPEDAVRLLDALVNEMDRRYETLKNSGTRNIKEYNTLIEKQKIKVDPKTGDIFEKYPYIVAIIDEYGDLMMTSGKAVEDPICRLAQMARAVGIHIVLATQRPSVKVVTGIIKANFPTRIAFRVMSQIDSRTILDVKGGESLLGRGDMLIIPPGEANLVRIQNALVETDEINQIVEHISKQPTDFKKIKIEAKAKESSADGYAGGGVDNGKKDAMFDEAKRLVIQNQMASVSMLQRGLSIGYARAGKLIDQLEKDGVVGPHLGSKPRDVLVKTYE